MIHSYGGNPELLGEKASLSTEQQCVRFIISRMCTLALHDPPQAGSAARLPDRSCGDYVPRADSGIAQGRVFRDLVPAITVASSPGVSVPARSTCQLYGVIAGYKAVTASENVRRVARDL